MSDNDIKAVLGLLIQQVERLSDEVEPIVRLNQRNTNYPFRVPDKAHAIALASRELREVAEKVLDRTHLPARDIQQEGEE